MLGFDVQIRFIKRSRRATIRVLAGNRIRVCVPWGFSKKEVDSILAKKSDWILKTHKLIEEQPPLPKVTWTKAEKEQLLIRLNERCTYFATKLEVKFKSVKIRRYKSRWGACSSKGEFVFNVNLAALPSDLVDYVVAHEVCHLKEMNHSPRFYAHLRSLGFERRDFHPRMKAIQLG